MTPQERGYLLLTSHLGDPERRVLTPAQLRTLAVRVRQMEQPREDRDLEQQDLVGLGYDRDTAARIVRLLSQEDLLEHYLHRGEKTGCIPVTRITEGYPVLLHQRLGLDSPGCLWAKGDLSILNRPAISLVGSRDIEEPNREFARAVGCLAAEQGLTLVSGNARGADRTAQEACLEAGGRVISVIADELSRQTEKRNLLYLSEEDFDAPFSSQRALRRNRCIHALGQMVFVAQCGLGKGGTWDGTVRNLRFGWSSVAGFSDGSQAMAELERMGAFLVDMGELKDICLNPQKEGFL